MFTKKEVQSTIIKNPDGTTTLFLGDPNRDQSHFFKDGDFDDVKFLKTPEEWPSGNVCSVKKRKAGDSGMPRCGIMKPNDPNVYEYNNTLLESFTSVENAVFAGWIVD